MGRRDNFSRGIPIKQFENIACFEKTFSGKDAQVSNVVHISNYDLKPTVSRFISQCFQH